MKQILLIHGAIGGSDQLIPLQEVLKDDFEIHHLEFSGHGAKAAISDLFSLQSFSSQLKDALRAIGSEVHIFGYSMGGFVALWHVANGDERIASITTLGTKMKWDEDIAQKEVKHLNPKALAEKVPKFAKALEYRHGEFWKAVLQRTAAFMHELGLSQPISESLMQRIMIPVQLCLADNDTMVSREETQQVHQWIAGSSLEMIPNSKHPIEQVDLMALASSIKSFVNRLD